MKLKIRADSMTYAAEITPFYRDRKLDTGICFLVSLSDGRNLICTKSFKDGAWRQVDSGDFSKEFLDTVYAEIDQAAALSLLDDMKHLSELKDISGLRMNGL